MRGPCFNPDNDRVNMTVYTTDQVIKYKPFTYYSPRLVLDEAAKHNYNDIPVIEWWNNRYKNGWLWSEISLIDAYDASRTRRIIWAIWMTLCC